LILLVAVAAPAALYFWRAGQRPQPQTLPAPAPASEPAIRHPIEAVGPAAESLPPLAESDEIMRHALAALFGQRLEKILISQDIVRRIVVTVDNLPRDHVPLRLLPVKPVGGFPLTTGTGQRLALSLENAARYRPFVRLTQAVPTDKLVALYTRFYPLFQQQYEDLGYPDSYFNDRIVEVIDHLLATPDVRRPLLLTQRRVLYEFTDPELEKLSAGEKILLRMGAGNRTRVKAKLREIRQALTSHMVIGDLTGP
jgi:hypothetical protein